MANAPAFALTTISGGINRLRTKGGADKNSLYDLLNGYVTQSSTVKVRPGTFRNANIAGHSAAGATKGLLAYQGQLHVFSNAVVGVPPGYALHVLSHPATKQAVMVTPAPLTPIVVTVGNMTSGGGHDMRGYSSATGAAVYSILVSPCLSSGGLTPPTLGALTINGVFSDTVSGAFAVSFLGNVPLSSLASVSGTDRLGNPFTLFTTGILACTVTYNAANNTTLFYWVGALGTPALPTTGTSTVKFTVNSGGAFDTPTNVANPIQIKEIHFSAPYLGGIYVVAEFSVNDPAILSQYPVSVFHYWIQSSNGGDNSNAWKAKTDYRIGDVVVPTTANGLTYVASRHLPANPVWTPNTAEAVNNIVEPITPNGFQYAVTAVLGATPTTGAVEPTWPVVDGGVVNENSALAVDQTITLAVAANTVTTPATPARYVGIAGGFKRGA